MSDNHTEKKTFFSKPGKSNAFFTSSEKSWGGALLGSTIGLLVSFFFTGNTGNVDNTTLRTKYWGSVSLGQTIGALAGYCAGKLAGRRHQLASQTRSLDPDRKFYLYNLPKAVITATLGGSGIIFLLNKVGVYDKLQWGKAKFIQPVMYGLIGIFSLVIPTTQWFRNTQEKSKKDVDINLVIEKEETIPLPGANVSESNAIPIYSKIEDNRRDAEKSKAPSKYL